MPAQTTIVSLMLQVEPITPQHLVGEVADLLLTENYQRFLSLPIVQDEMPVGSISRHRMQNVFMTMYGRELYARRPISDFMNPSPLVVAGEQALEQASRFITENIQFPVVEDFIVTEDGRYAGVGVVVDVLKGMEARIASRNAELARAYTRLKDSQAQLVQSEKMASLGQMVAGVAHEINTPLGYVKNNVEMKRLVFADTRRLLGAYDQFFDSLFSDAPDEDQVDRLSMEVKALREGFDGDTADEVEQLFADTLYGIDQIGEMVINLKNFSRLDQAPVADVDLNECVNSALLIAKNVIKHKAEVVKSLADLPPISCSPSQINQVLLNLFTNAAQAISGQGKILIKTSFDDGWVHISVQDTGRGIPKGNLARIFDPFYTTKPIGQGTGLGLSISYKIIQQHKGHIRVASQEGVGTRFLISLPRQAVTSKKAA